MKSLSIPVEGVNLTPDEHIVMQCDMHCPDVGTSGLNFWKDRCELRQRDKSQKRCFKGCYIDRPKSTDKPKDKSKIHKPTDPLILEILIKMHKKGISRKDIRDILGVSYSVISKTINK